MEREIFTMRTFQQNDFDVSDLSLVIRKMFIGYFKIQGWEK